ncbi:hypothetical protein RhiirC2_720406 [Rhizophagus irregularis]|uniref:Uncharacterized protein n=1 Tax=Rhizophagus irregularis TaxID=588596 RepID=A0A2N1MAE5_9GLOM|nr:hypothetical protein RhiirC2_720406 [Rhizophagus irregularis]
MYRRDGILRTMPGIDYFTLRMQLFNSKLIFIQRITIKDPLNTEGVLHKVKNNIYNALVYYWDTPSDIGLLAALLDPHYKELDLELEDKKNEIIQKLRNEFNKLNSDNSNNTTPVTPVAEPSNLAIPFPDAEFSLRSQKEYRKRH